MLYSRCYVAFFIMKENEYEFKNIFNDIMIIVTETTLTSAIYKLRIVVKDISDFVYTKDKMVVLA